MARPRLLSLLVAAQVAGILLADSGRVGLALGAAGAGFLLAGVRRRPSACALATAVAASALAHAASLEQAADDRAHAAGEHVLDVRIEGVRPSGAGLALRLGLSGAGLPRTAELFLARRLLDEAPAIARARVGERWRLRARLRPQHAPANPGASDRGRERARRGLGARATLVDSGLAVRTGDDPLRRLLGPFERIRRRAATGLAERGRGGALLSALSLGHREALGPHRPAFARLGVAHLLAISGLHLGLVLGASYALARLAIRRLGGRAGASDGRALALACALGAAFGYALLAGFGIPLRRALGFAAAMVLAQRLRRPGAARAGLWISASGLLASEPAALFELGPQLSFASAAALVYASASPQPADPPGAVRVWLRDGIRVSTVALAATSPLLAAWGIASGAVPLLANLFLVPWTALVLLPAALLSAGLAGAGVGAGIVDAAAGVATLTLDAIEACAQALPPLAARPAAGIARLIFAGGLALAVVRVRATRSRVVLALALVVALRVGPVDRDRGDLLVALDVGSGDALLLRSGLHAALVDGGLALPGVLDLGRSRVLPALAALGVGRLDVVVATHADADHAGGLAAVVRSLPVGRLWLPIGGSADPGFRELARAAEARGVPIESISGQRATLALGERLRLEPLWPLRPVGERSTRDRNASSIVLRATLGDLRLLLAGDLGRAQERSLLRSGRSLRAEVLKVGHHGSAGATTGAWLDAVDPIAAIVSAACERRGLPATAVLERLRARGVSIWWTARDGAVLVRPGPLSVASLAPAGSCRSARR